MTRYQYNGYSRDGVRVTGITSRESLDKGAEGISRGVRDIGQPNVTVAESHNETVLLYDKSSAGNQTTSYIPAFIITVHIHDEQTTGL